VLASRLHWRLLIATILVMVAAAWIAPRYVRPPDIQENRVLAPKPEWPKRLDQLDDFRKSADAYVADHFPARPYLIGGLNRLRMLLGVGGSNRVIIGRRGWLFYDDDTHLGAARGDPPMTAPEVRNWLVFLAGRTEMLKARRVPYLVVAAPVKETIYPQFGPYWYRRPNPNRPAIFLPRLARETGAGDVFYLYPSVAAATRAGWTTYSRHDTHWNAYGAYAGYVGLMTRLHAMGLTDGPKPLSAFTVHPGHPQTGPRDLALMLGVSSFVDLDFPHIDNVPGEVKVSTSYLTATLDWTGDQVIDTGEVGKPVLLMTRDSFSNEIQSLLYPHFSRLILAHNQNGFWRQDLIDRFKPDIVLLEVIESGLRVGMGDGPQPSPETTARIDAMLRRAPIVRQVTPPVPGLRSTDKNAASIMNAAEAATRCTVDVATLKPGPPNETELSLAGWIWDEKRHDDSPDGMVRLRGAGVDLFANMAVNRPRADVAAALSNPSAKQSGFVAEFLQTGLRPGAYSLTVYRRSAPTWIACPAKQPLLLP
jgi:hypothetical protein